MDFFTNLQKFIPWASTLPALPKAGISAVVVLLTLIFFYVLWMPAQSPATNPRVVEAYNTMRGVLGELDERPNGSLEYQGAVVDPILMRYYRPYQKIAMYVHAHPGDTKGAYEAVAANGGEGRTFTTDTQALESAVSTFYRRYEAAEQGGDGR